MCVRARAEIVCLGRAEIVCLGCLHLRSMRAWGMQVHTSEGGLNNFRVVAPTIEFSIAAPGAKQVRYAVSNLPELAAFAWPPYGLHALK